MPHDSNIKVRLDMLINKELKLWLQAHVREPGTPFRDVTHLVTSLIEEYCAQQGRINEDEVVEQV